MSYDDTELTKQELASFEKAQIKTISKTDFVNSVKASIEKGGELS